MPKFSWKDTTDYLFYDPITRVGSWLSERMQPPKIQEPQIQEQETIPSRATDEKIEEAIKAEELKPAEEIKKRIEEKNEPKSLKENITDLLRKYLKK